MKANASEKLHDTVVFRWGWDIVSGALPAGTRLGAEDASANLGVSRTVIREAVRVLESMGLVEVRRRVGITVLPPERWNSFDSNIIRWRLAGPQRTTHLKSLSQLRSAIEPLAARLAAASATSAQRGELTAAAIGMSSTARSADSEIYLAHDSRFHRTLLAGSGNPMLAGLADVVAEVLAGRARHALMPSQANPDAVRLHTEVASAVAVGDADGAHRAMQEIVAESADAIEKTVPSDEGAGQTPLPSLLAPKAWSA